MDSLSLYYHIQSKYSSIKYTTDDSKLNEVDKLIKQIFKEIFNPQVPLKDSSFINEVSNMADWVYLYQKIWTSRVFLSDAYIVVQGLVEYINNPGFTAIISFKGYEKYLFNGDKIDNDEMGQVMEVKRWLKQLRKRADKVLSENNPNKKYTSGIEKPQLYSFDNSNIKKAYVNEVEVQLPKKSEVQSLKKNEVRSEYNKVNIQLWHDEQAGINAKLMEMQPAISQLLKDFMSFSDNITEQYVLQFARMQIELFNLIHDGYVYHKKKAELNGNEDYANAICNYNEYMLSIIDHLAAFGIEEISSTPGTFFDGTVQEADVASFSTKTALVAESFRTGFRYKDIIIQKEKIKIKN